MFTDQMNISESIEFYRLVVVQRGPGARAPLVTTALPLLSTWTQAGTDCCMSSGRTADGSNARNDERAADI